jgi:hypothetical protein
MLKTIMAKTITLDEFVSQLRGVYGDDLKSVVLYGSAVGGEHIKKKSDYNILVVVETLPLERLQAASNVTRAWRNAGNPPPMTFTQQEWNTTADVFPMEYTDIQLRHQVLYGSDPFAQVEIDWGDLRMQVEREAMGKVLRLRQGAMLAGKDEKDQLELLTASLSALMVILRGVLQLHGVTPPQNYAELVRDASERVGFDPAPFYDVIHHVRGERALSKDRTNAVLAGYIRGMEAVAAHVDGLTHTRTHA